MKHIHFHDKIALITGSGQGLGKAYAKELALHGAAVIINDIARTEDGLPMAEKTAEEIRKNGGNAYADMSTIHTEEGVSALVDRIIKQFGRIDIFIHNAGIFIEEHFMDIQYENWKKHFDTHLQGAFFLLKKICPIMCGFDYGRIVFITSTAGLFGIPGQIAYGTSKMALLGLAKGLSAEFTGKNIICNVVSPLAATNMTKKALHESLWERLSPEEVAPIVAFLCSEKCVKGGNIYVAGGGYFSAMGFVEGKGVHFNKGIADADKIYENFHAISSLEDADTVNSAKQAGKRILRHILKW